MRLRQYISIDTPCNLQCISPEGLNDLRHNLQFLVIFCGRDLPSGSEHPGMGVRCDPIIDDEAHFRLVLSSDLATARAVYISMNRLPLHPDE